MTENESGVPADPELRPTAADGLEGAVWDALRGVEDPELPISIVDLGLIYDVTVEGRRAEIDLTLTYSGCPGRDLIVRDAEDAVRTIDGIDAVETDVVYSPPWNVERITARGREALDEFGLALPGNEGRPDPACHD